MTTTLSSGNPTAQNRKQKTLSLLSNPDEQEPMPSRGRRIMESGNPASAALLSQVSRLVVEFSYNTQSWQCWHLCTTSNGNKLETIEGQISFNANLHLLWHFELKLK